LGRRSLLTHATPPPRLAPLSLHDALPIFREPRQGRRVRRRQPQPGADLCLGGAAAAPCERRRRGAREPAGEPLRRNRSQLCAARSEEHTSELQSLAYLVCRLLLETKNAAI